MKPLIRLQMIALTAMLGGYILAFACGSSGRTAQIVALAAIFGASGLASKPWVSAISITAFPAWCLGAWVFIAHNVTAAALLMMSSVIAARLAVLARFTARDLRIRYPWALAALVVYGATIEATMGTDSPFPALAGIVLLYEIGRLHARSVGESSGRPIGAAQ